MNSIFNTAIQGFPTPKTNFYKVYVRSITYNQSSYILDCLNGVAFQKTEFPFVHHVIDDCSTDGEADVIMSFVERECDIDNAEVYDNEICKIILANNKSNLNYTLVVYLLKKNLFHNFPEKSKLYLPWRDACEYEAICEGDDYWTDPKKIQKQASFLDQHMDYSLIGGNADINDFKGQFIKKFSDEASMDISIDSIINKWTIPTASMMFRTYVMRKMPYIENAPQDDIIMQMTCADLGKCRYDSAVCCVYRWLVPGSSTARVRNNQLDYYQRHYDMWVKLNEYFKFKYEKAIQKRLKETKRKIIRERVYLKVPVLRKLREIYRTFRGY